MNNQQIEANKEQRPTDVASGAVLGDSAEAVETALMLVSISPVKTRMWMEAAMQMAEYCQGIENCDQAAMRVLANEVYRLRKTVEVAEGAIMNGEFSCGAVPTMRKIENLVKKGASVWTL